VKKPGSATDPLWYKDAIIYELHVRAFADSNDDGIGDFQGLLQKLDYLLDLGVTCIWLLPFFASPLRDDGYDISDYLSVHPDYGTTDDFRAFLEAAHDRGLQVMIELVVNHTSDKHPWFQAARLAPAGSSTRNYYVWSDTDQKYLEARIIFTDTEKSNWTFDPIAKAYYWHRFFSHQPDLNYDNPEVIEEVLKVMRYWLDMGVDGVRIDAIPYLVEREGTSCENLPETHQVIRRIRADIDAQYSNRLILAEANQWPTDVRPYFGEGDECHMAFHFPLMPRIYMALRQEDRLPITEIMAETPAIPDSCQWGLFLRNHDELTLEMVTDDERDYMYLAYSADPRMRINIGIRRRLAPLLDNSRRRIELLISLLFSLPGTPILYYGDEIGMGDNIYLGDRHGVRTPMQWNADRNAGFSKAVPAKLYSPVIMDPVWGYQVVNVEAQQSDASSLLHWMRNMIALRRLFQVFGRGSLTFFSPENRKVLAYLRKYEGQYMLCVANLSRFAQPVSLDLSEFDGRTPVEVLGYVSFPVISRHGYVLTLSPYAFLWLELQAAYPAPEMRDEDSSEDMVWTGWHDILAGPGAALFSEKLRSYLQTERWYGGKSRKIDRLRVKDWGRLNSDEAIYLLIDLDYTDGRSDSYAVPLAVSFGKVAEKLRGQIGVNAVIDVVRRRPTGESESGLIQDAIDRPDICHEILGLFKSEASLPMTSGQVGFSIGSSMSETGTVDDDRTTPRKSRAEQSNTSVIFGNELILKIYRRIEPGINPDVEIGRFLTDATDFGHVAPYRGSIDYTGANGEQVALGILQGLVQNEGDGWQWTLEELERYYDICAARSFSFAEHQAIEPNIDFSLTPALEKLAREHAGMYLEAALLLGQRTAEMHVALATPTTDHAFAVEPLEPKDLEAEADVLANLITRVFAAIKTNMGVLTDESTESAGLILSRRKALVRYAEELCNRRISGTRSRIHGDYHLGQLLRVKGDYVILDFEGEPARSLNERRAKYPPVKDVAGMLRSYSYAAATGLQLYVARRGIPMKRLAPWSRLWESAVSSAFLRGYQLGTAQTDVLRLSPDDLSALLQIYRLEKTLYELLYELNNRPSWAHIPMDGILSLQLPVDLTARD
jgi:maltose alpha-D-glucosyltransferase/alpha-amylase